MVWRVTTVIVLIMTIAFVVVVTSKKRTTQKVALWILLAMAWVAGILAFIATTPAHGADLKPKMFPTAEARLLEQELVNAHIKREMLPSTKTDIYACEDYDLKITRLVELYDQLNRTEMARQWRLHLGHVFEFSLNFCEDVQDSERFKKSYELYRLAGDNIRARRAAGKEARRLRYLYANGDSVETEDINGNHRWEHYYGKGDQGLLKEAKKWEKLAH